MDNMGKAYKEILENLERRLKDNPDLEYVKSEFSNLFMEFFDELDSLRMLYEEKIETMLDRQSYFEEKLNKIEQLTTNIEKEVMPDESDEFIRNIITAEKQTKFEEYLDEDNECEIVCPYCEDNFYIQIEGLERVIRCPYCNNLIEVDWND